MNLNPFTSTDKYLHIGDNVLTQVKTDYKRKPIPDDLALLVFASQYYKEHDAVLCNYTGKKLRFRTSKRCKYRIPEWEDREKSNVDHIIGLRWAIPNGYPELEFDFMNLQMLHWKVNQHDKGDQLSLHAQFNATQRGIYHGKETIMSDQLRRLRAGEKIGALVPREWNVKMQLDLGYPPVKYQLLDGRIMRLGDFSRRFPQFNTVLRQAVVKYIKKAKHVR